MKILDFLHSETVLTDLTAGDKKGVLEELAAPVAEATGIKRDEIVRVLMERERLGSTGIGEGLGIPHGKLKNLDDMIIGFGLSRRGVDFDAIDGRPARIFFLIITPEASTGLHLKLLARISRLLKEERVRERLRQVESPAQVLAIIEEEDEEF